MPGAPIPLGPFTGGVNNQAEQGTIADDELWLSENFEFDTDGSLVSRPAIVQEEIAAPSLSSPQQQIRASTGLIRKHGR
jgi:hypothetical protein